MRTRKTFSGPKELYDRLINNAEGLSLSDIAKEYDQSLNGPLLAYTVGQYAAENALPLPAFIYVKAAVPKPVFKLLRRSHNDRDVRVSGLKVTATGLHDVMSFRLLGDPLKKILVIVDAELQVKTVEEALRLLYDGQVPASGPLTANELEVDEPEIKTKSALKVLKVQNLRLPSTSSGGSKSKTAN